MRKLKVKNFIYEGPEGPNEDNFEKDIKRIFKKRGFYGYFDLKKAYVRTNRATKGWKVGIVMEMNAKLVYFEMDANEEPSFWIGQRPTMKKQRELFRYYIEAAITEYQSKFIENENN